MYAISTHVFVNGNLCSFVAIAWRGESLVSSLQQHPFRIHIGEIVVRRKHPSYLL